MNKEFKNIWKFVKSEELGIGRMALSMAKGLNEMDNTNYQNADNYVSNLQLQQKIYDMLDSFPILDTLNPVHQMKQWYWFFISATMQGREADADNCLEVYNGYAKELLG